MSLVNPYYQRLYDYLSYMTNKHTSFPLETNYKKKLEKNKNTIENENGCFLYHEFINIIINNALAVNEDLRNQNRKDRVAIENIQKDFDELKIIVEELRKDKQYAHSDKIREILVRNGVWK